MVEHLLLLLLYKISTYLTRSFKIKWWFNFFYLSCFSVFLFLSVPYAYWINVFYEADCRGTSPGHKFYFFQKQPFADAFKNFVIFPEKYLCRSLFLIRLQAWRPKAYYSFIKKTFWHRCFTVNILLWKLLRPPFPQSTFGRLLLFSFPLLL